MKLIYSSEKLQKQCTNVKDAGKLFGGNKGYIESLLARIHALEMADCLKDIIVQPQFGFHNLSGDRDGSYAMNVKTHRDPWRIILIPVDENEQPYSTDRSIDEICTAVEIVLVEEVSKHYE